MAPILLVDEQTAGVVPKGDYNVESRIYEGDGTGTGLLVDVMVGYYRLFHARLEP